MCTTGPKVKRIYVKSEEPYRDQDLLLPTMFLFDVPEFCFFTTFVRTLSYLQQSNKLTSA